MRRTEFRVKVSPVELLPTIPLASKESRSAPQYPQKVACKWLFELRVHECNAEMYSPRPRGRSTFLGH